MNYDMRLTALNIARELPHADADALIYSAKKIEAHLRGKIAQPLLETAPEYSNETKAWTGIAQDLKALLLSGSTIVCKSRHIGMTTFLADFAAEHTRQSKHVLWLSATLRQAEETKSLIDRSGGVPLYIEFGGLNRFKNFDENGVENKLAARRSNYDLIIVDGLAYLPYSADAEFWSTIVPLSDHIILASEPGQARGLFYNLWQNNPNFRKVMLTWHTPLYDDKLPEERKNEVARLREALGDDRFRNQFECAFRECSEE